MSCLSFYLQWLEHGWHINICPVSDQTMVLRTIQFITRVELVFISVNLLPPTVPAIEKGNSDLRIYPTAKEAVCSLDVIQKPSCCIVCPVRLWEEWCIGMGSPFQQRTVEEKDPSGGDTAKNIEVKIPMGRPIGEEIRKQSQSLAVLKSQSNYSCVVCSPKLAQMSKLLCAGGDSHSGRK